MSLSNDPTKGMLAPYLPAQPEAQARGRLLIPIWRGRVAQGNLERHSKAQEVNLGCGIRSEFCWRWLLAC